MEYIDLPVIQVNDVTLDQEESPELQFKSTKNKELSETGTSDETLSDKENKRIKWKKIKKLRNYTTNGVLPKSMRYKGMHLPDDGANAENSDNNCNTTNLKASSVKSKGMCTVNLPLIDNRLKQIIFIYIYIII